MTGKEYTDRLIDDLENTIKTRMRVADPFTQIRNLGITGEASMQDFMAALDVGEADAHLNNLPQFINTYDKIVKDNPNKKMDIYTFKDDIINNRKSVEETFQKIIDDENLVNPYGNKLMSEYLIDILDYVHSASK